MKTDSESNSNLNNHNLRISIYLKSFLTKLIVIEKRYVTNEKGKRMLKARRFHLNLNESHKNSLNFIRISLFIKRQICSFEK